MGNDEIVYGFLLLGVIVGLILLVYGMSLTAGKSMNAPAIIGGAVSLGAVGVMALMIARHRHPTH